MLSIRTILNKNYKNPTLQRALLTHTVESTMTEILNEMKLPNILGTQLSILPKIDTTHPTLLHIYCKSTNSMLLTHMKLEASTVSSKCLERFNEHQQVYSEVKLYFLRG